MRVVEEQEHFDRLSRERLANGFVADLERMRDSDYFYLSPFRRKALANLAHKEHADFRVRHLAARLPNGAPILDLGCGSGWFSLELARAGFDVTAADLSKDSIALASETLAGADLRGGRVEYHVGDLNEWEPPRDGYAAISYVGILHHLADPAAMVQRIRRFAVQGHLMVAADPLPQNYGPMEAAFALLVRVLLSAGGAWYEEVPPPEGDKVDDVLEALRYEFSEWADKAEKQQSPMNNASDGESNLAILERHYEVIEREDFLPTYLRLIGGIRAGTDEEDLAVARFIIEMERVFYEGGALKAGGFNLFGRAR